MDKPASQTTLDQDVLLLLQVPRTNNKKELSAEQMFASLHGLLAIPNPKIFKNVKRERISFEIAVVNQRIGFYVWVPRYLRKFVEDQIYAQYPNVNITEVDDYSKSTYYKYKTTLVSELKLTQNSALPIKTFQSFDVDPLAAITGSLAKFNNNEESWIQIIIRPAPPSWHRRDVKYIAGLKGKNTGVTGVVSLLVSPPKATKSRTLDDSEQTKIKAAEVKSQKLAFEATIRIVYRGDGSTKEGKLRLQSIIASFKQFNTTYLNGFDEKRPIVDDPYLIGLFRLREFHGPGFICNIEEIASLYHLPHTNVETPFIIWAPSQTAEPPANLPIIGEEYRPELSAVAATNFRGQKTRFALPRTDRPRHLYVIGQTGVGKSGLLELLTISDIYSSDGFAVIDPHGDYAVNVLKRIPKERIKDVVYFNPSDSSFPIAFNPMEVQDKKLRLQTCSELIGVLKKMFDSWGPRLEYILRYSILALLDYPDSTMLDITRILTDKKFRDEVVTHINDPVVRNFWMVEFANWSGRFATDAVAPVLNKIGAFTANPLVRNIIGQPKSSFNIRQLMDERKILIVNLSHGLVGEDNAALLGALLVTKIQIAAMSRADTTAEQRVPFYLYVDEFQNFATESFATILSEARKYGLYLTVANQYIAQMIPKVKNAIFGNVGSIIAFRTSIDDAKVLQRYFEPKFDEYDLINMSNRHFVISMTINSERVPAFSAITLNLPPIIFDYTEDIIKRSRDQYAVRKRHAERSIEEKYFSLSPPEEPLLPSGIVPEIAAQGIKSVNSTSKKVNKPKKSTDTKA